MSENAQQPQQTLGTMLGLGLQWQPGPAGIEMKRVQGPMGTMHVMILVTTAGTVGVALTPDDLRTWIDVMQRELTGLIVARDAPPPSPVNGQNLS